MIVPLALAFVAFVWLKTNAVVDFLGWLLCRVNFCYMNDYRHAPELERDSMNFPLWLSYRHPNFLTTMVSCPLCFSFWSNALFAPNCWVWLAGSFITLVGFCVLDKLYHHG